jgi:hypothetical protein
MDLRLDVWNQDLKVHELNVWNQKENNPKRGCMESNKKKPRNWMYGIGIKKFMN